MQVSLNTARLIKPKPAVFLDRDGTINVEKNYLYRYEDWEWIPGAPQAISRLNKAGYLVVVVSNQAGVARGLYTEHDVDVLHDQVSVALEAFGAHIDAYFYCPHHPDFSGACTCRKPSPGMLTKAADMLNIDMRRSWMIGDKAIDVIAGQRAGVKGVLVESGYGKAEIQLQLGEARIARDLSDAIEIIPELD